MVSKFGTSLPSGAARIDLTSYAKKTDLGAIASLSSLSRRVLYRDVYSILKETQYYALASPFENVHYTNVNYTPTIQRDGNYSLESYTRTPYPTLSMPDNTNSIYLYSICKFDRLPSGSLFNRILMFRIDSDPFLITRSAMGYYYTLPGNRRAVPFQEPNTAESAPESFIFIEFHLRKGENDYWSARARFTTKEESTPSATFTKVFPNIHFGPGVRHFRPGSYAILRAGQFLFAVSDKPLPVYDQEHLIAFFLTERI